VLLDDNGREIPPSVHNRGYSAIREQAVGTCIETSAMISKIRCGCHEWIILIAVFAFCRWSSSGSRMPKKI
jgi:hypothetical protein